MAVLTTPHERALTLLFAELEAGLRLLTDIAVAPHASFFRMSGKMRSTGDATLMLAGRAGESTEIAAAYLFLMRGTFTTGQTIVVDGGMLLV
jgi:NAD(P)-dependent dehydrogenase (short-subunit alcohol dehydrogenase family)